MANDDKHGHEALRRGRWSDSGAEYFLTCVTAQRGTGLHAPQPTAEILEVATEMEAESLWVLRTAVIMPDHAHLLIELGSCGNLAAVARVFKGRGSAAIRRHGLQWQRGYYDHRMRPHEDRRPVFHYIFMNPYRADLLPAHETWPGYYCRPEDWRWFEPLTNQCCPFPEWLL